MAVTSPAARPLAAPAPAAADRRRRPAAASLLLLALLAASAYAAFAAGAAKLPQESRLQVGVALVAAMAAGAWLWGFLRVEASVTAWLGFALLGGLAAWSGVSLAWSAAPDATWVALNRAVAYVLVLLLALAAGSSHRGAVRAVAIGYLALASAVALYALGGKLAPGWHLRGVVDLNQTRDVARLRAPLQYWNALALCCALAVPIAVLLAAARDLATWRRVLALILGCVLLVTIALTYSRGGFITLAVAMGVALLACGAGRLRALAALALAAAAGVAPVLFAFSRHDLTANGVALARREDDGALLALVLGGSLVALVLVAALLVRLERRVGWTRRRTRVVAGALLACVALGAGAGVAAAALSDRGLSGTATHAWDRFSSVRRDRQGDPARLVSTNGGNRWVWWQEAARAWADRPATGWGAGAFVVEHKRYRRDLLDVVQPHSLPLQLLADTGSVGAALGLGGLALLLAAGVGSLRRRPAGVERALAAALLAGAAGWLAHSAYDWDWDIPGVTLPALVFLGVLAGRPRPPGGAPDVPPRGGRLRALALAGAVVAMAVTAVSAVLPAWSRTVADDALAAVGPHPSPAQLDRADRRARLSARLDPLSVDGLFARAAIAERRGRLDRARGFLEEAVRRQPDDVLGWYKLAQIDIARGDLTGLDRASARALALDPRSPFARELAGRAAAVLAPAGDVGHRHRDSPAGTREALSRFDM